jgi:hypothetical protein
MPDLRTVLEHQATHSIHGALKMRKFFVATVEIHVEAEDSVEARGLIEEDLDYMMEVSNDDSHIANAFVVGAVEPL